MNFTSSGISFNRTILELKRGTFSFAQYPQHPFNRTILELKQSHIVCIKNPIGLLIVPFWN